MSTTGTQRSRWRRRLIYLASWWPEAGLLGGATVIGLTVTPTTGSPILWGLLGAFLLYTVIDWYATQESSDYPFWRYLSWDPWRRVCLSEVEAGNDPAGLSAGRWRT